MSLLHRTIGTAAALLLPAVGAVACQPVPPPIIPAIAGITTSHTPPYPGDRGYGSTTTITLTSAHLLAVTCNTGSTLVINATPTQVKCNSMESLRITGTASADTVHVDLQTGPLVSVSLGGGNDRSYVAGRGMSTTDGGDGNDTLAAITVLPYGSYGQSVREVTELHGGPGDDTLTNLGWSGNGTVDETGDDLIDFLGMTLDGGPGADVLHGSPVRPDLIVTDAYDTLDVQSGPGDITLQGTNGPDAVVVDLNGNWGPRGTITTPDGVAHRFALSRGTRLFTIDTGDGDDDITVSHRSYTSDTDVTGGHGADHLHVRPSLAGYQFDEDSVEQPGAKTIGYRADVESTDVTLVPRP